MKWTRFFIYSAGGILLASALIRFTIAVGTGQVLALPDPLLGIPLRFAVLLVGLIELTVAWICLFRRQIQLQIAWLGWLATNYVVFWIGLLMTHCQSQGTCLGSLTNPLVLSRGVAGYITEFAPFYLVLGSYIACLWLWLSKEARQERVGQRDAMAGLLKMFCPACGGRIKFSVENLGQKIDCPCCKASVTLRKPDETLKMSCFFCKEHIEFPAHALGRKIKCPHCKMEIGLREPV